MSDYVLSVCVDCLSMAANGETSGTPDRPPLGLIPVGAHAVPGGPHECGDPLTVECDCDDLGFSWRACEGCGSHLGGDRYAVTVFDR